MPLVLCVRADLPSIVISPHRYPMRSLTSRGEAAFPSKLHLENIMIRCTTWYIRTNGLKVRYPKKGYNGKSISAIRGQQSWGARYD